SIIGFEAPLGTPGVYNGLTLILNINGTGNQTFTFNGVDSPITTINATIVGGKAYLSYDGLNFFVRDNLRVAPGNIQIVGGTAVAPLGLSARIIAQLSENFLIANVPFNVNPDQLVTYIDQNGVLQDYYAITTLDPLDNESLKTPFRQAISFTG